MEQRVSIITLGVADLDRSREFYEAWDGGDRWPRREVLYSSKPGGWVSRCSHDTSLRRMRALLTTATGSAEYRWHTTLAIVRRSTRCSPRPKQRAQDCSSPPRKRSGAAIRGTSRIQTGFHGRSPGTRFSGWRRTEVFASPADPSRWSGQGQPELRVRGVDVLVEPIDWSHPASWQGELIFLATCWRLCPAPRMIIL